MFEETNWYIKLLKTNYQRIIIKQIIIINDNYNIHGILWPSSMWDWEGVVIGSYQINDFHHYTIFKPGTGNYMFELNANEWYL